MQHHTAVLSMALAAAACQPPMQHSKGGELASLTVKLFKAAFARWQEIGKNKCLPVN
jgi:hypothetical protein